uniref:tRNA/rRNA methyltransferase SpoU type domain-containing protein n=1 Tax=Kalanchoe fedtschenkoi TaxID=63787 RepID=A0A7N0ZRX3_KALFE
MICASLSPLHHPPLITLTSTIRAKFETQFGKDADDGPAKPYVLPKVIASAANPFVKHCLKLRLNSSYRHAHGSVVVVGTTPIREIYQYHDLTNDEVTGIESLLVLDKADIPEGLESLDDRVVRVNPVVMKKISGLQSTDSVEAIALMKLPKQYLNIDDGGDCHEWFPSAHRILVLEGIQDPGNMGTLLRSAMAFKWDGAFLLPGCCDPFNEKALRASRGASFQLPIVSGSWTSLQSLTKHRGMQVLAAHPHSKLGHIQASELSPNLARSLHDTPLCLLLGSEGSGLSQRAIDACQLVSIPMSGEFESLNVSIAGGIFLYMLQTESRNPNF